MRNIILTIVVLLIIFIGLAPFIDGYLFKKNYLHLIEIINQDGRAKVDVLEYRKGWFTSYAKLRVSPGKIATGPNAPHLILENHITHGPIVRDKVSGGWTTGYAWVQTVINFSDSARRFFDERLNSDTGIEINTRATMGGKWFNKLQLKQIVIAKPYLGKLTWGGLNGTVDFRTQKNEIQNFKVVLNFGALLIDSEPDFENPFFKSVSIQAVDYEKEGHRLANNLWSSSGKMVIPNITVTMTSGANLVVNQYQGSSWSGQGANADTYSGMSGFSIKSLEIPNNISLVPSIENVAFKMNIQNLSAQGFKEFMAYVKSMKGVVTDPDMNKYFATAAKLITPSTVVSQNLEFNTSLGVFQNDSKVVLQPNAVITTPTDLLQKAIITINLRAGVALVEKLIAAYIDHMTSMAQATVSSDEPSSRARVSNAKETFNQTAGTLFQQNKINMSQSMQIIGLADHHPSLESFETSLKAMNLPADVTTQVNQAYQRYHGELARIASTPSPQQAAAQQQAQKKQMLTATVQQLISNLLSQDYMKMENNNYILSMVYQNNTLTLNGKPIDPSLLMGGLNPGPVEPSYQEQLEQANKPVPAPAAPTTNQPIPLLPAGATTVGPQQGTTVTPQSGTPVTPQPGAPVTPQPGTPVTPQPGTPVIPQPGTPVIPQPGTPVTPQPGTPVTPQPGTPVIPQPGTPVTPQPGTPVTPQPGTPVTPQPGTPVTPQPGAPVTPQPGTPATQPTMSP